LFTQLSDKNYERGQEMYERDFGEDRGRVIFRGRGIGKVERDEGKGIE